MKRSELIQRVKFRRDQVFDQILDEQLGDADTSKLVVLNAVWSSLCAEVARLEEEEEEEEEEI